MVVESEGLFYIDENQLALKGILQIVKIKYAQTSMIIAWEMHYKSALQCIGSKGVCIDEFCTHVRRRGEHKRGIFCNHHLTSDFTIFTNVDKKK